jgi:hypothetical protein
VLSRAYVEKPSYNPGLDRRFMLCCDAKRAFAVYSVVIKLKIKKGSNVEVKSRHPSPLAVTALRVVFQLA